MLCPVATNFSVYTREDLDLLLVYITDISDQNSVV